jgi:cell division protein FtsL
MPAQTQTLSLARFSRLRRQELVERRALRLIFLGLVILSLAGLLYLTQASAVTTTTYEIQELQRQKQRLQRRRDHLRAEIAALTSPERVEARARALGFRAAPPAEFLAVTEVPVLALSSASVMTQQSSVPPTRLGTDASPPESRPPAPLETFLSRTSNWLQIAMGLLPAPQQVEAGAAHP